MINKYGNDFKNNIMWNKEYPFIPEVTNDVGFTIHEGDIVEFYDKYDKRYYAARVYKIYNKDFIWTRCDFPHVKQCDHIESANTFLPHLSNATPPKLVNFENQGVFNYLEHFLSQVYSELYDEELSLPDDWHFDDEKYEKKRLEEVARLKNKY
ncbi:MAG: hypothetical protein NC310_08010 [Roseburia sp.]|nr:hypothetical protein [Roseburia sp.]